METGTTKRDQSVRVHEEKYHVASNSARLLVTKRGHTRNRSCNSRPRAKRTIVVLATRHDVGNIYKRRRGGHGRQKMAMILLLIHSGQAHIVLLSFRLNFRGNLLLKALLSSNP